MKNEKRKETQGNAASNANRLPNIALAVFASFGFLLASDCANKVDAASTTEEATAEKLAARAQVYENLRKMATESATVGETEASPQVARWGDFAQGTVAPWTSTYSPYGSLSDDSLAFNVVDCFVAGDRFGGAKLLRAGKYEEAIAAATKSLEEAKPWNLNGYNGFVKVRKYRNSLRLLGQALELSGDWDSARDVCGALGGKSTEFLTSRHAAAKNGVGAAFQYVAGLFDSSVSPEKSRLLEIDVKAVAKRVKEADAKAEAEGFVRAVSRPAFILVDERGNVDQDWSALSRFKTECARIACPELIYVVLGDDLIDAQTKFLEFRAARYAEFLAAMEAEAKRLDEEWSRAEEAAEKSGGRLMGIRPRTAETLAFFRDLAETP